MLHANKKNTIVRRFGFVLFACKYNEKIYGCLFRRIGGKAANSGTSILVDSDSEEEPNRKAIGSRKRRLSSCVPDDSERAEEVSYCCQTMAIF